MELTDARILLGVALKQKAEACSQIGFDSVQCRIRTWDIFFARFRPFVRIVTLRRWQ